MIRYQAAALAMKAFSALPATRRFYRRLGNLKGNLAPGSVHGGYPANARWLIERIERERPSVSQRRLLLELGTGWLHYYGIAAALALDARVDLYDVWDNRQFRRLAAAFSDPERVLRDLGVSGEDARRKALDIGRAGSFEEVYDAAGLRYVLDPGGELEPLESGAYDVVFSMDVLEHVHAASLPRSIAAMHRILKPGGVAIHQVGVDDHLTHYDRSASQKQYLAYGPLEWKLRFENVVQYTNLASFDEFRRLFREAGFQEVEATAERAPDHLDRIRVAPRFRNQSRESLEAVRLFLVYRKPAPVTALRASRAPLSARAR